MFFPDRAWHRANSRNKKNPRRMLGFEPTSFFHESARSSCTRLYWDFPQHPSHVIPMPEAAVLTSLPHRAITTNYSRDIPRRRKLTFNQRTTLFPYQSLLGVRTRAPPICRHQIAICLWKFIVFAITADSFPAGAAKSPYSIPFLHTSHARVFLSTRESRLGAVFASY